MRVQVRALRPTSVVAGVLSAALIVSASGAMQATAKASVIPVSGGSNLSGQIAAAYNSASGKQLRSELASLFSDPAVPAAAEAVLQSDGPTGRNDLTGFQKDILKALVAETSSGSPLAAEITGKPLSFAQRLAAQRLEIQLLTNPAITTLMRAGLQLGRSSQLSPDIATAAANNGVVYSDFTPATTANQGGSAALDTVVGDIAAIRTGSAFNNYTSLLSPITQDPGFPSLLKGQQPLTIAAFLPAANLIALLIPNDHDPAITDIVKSSLEILGGLAAVGAAVLLAPEELTAAAIVGVGLAIFAGASAVAVGIIDLGTALDCDHDGDPFDPDDVPGVEC